MPALAIVSYSELVTFSERSEKLGFRRDTSEDAPTCRWLSEGSKLDVMPLEESLLGFSNRWYREAMTEAAKFELPSGHSIRVITAPYFVATKLEAFHGRGKNDFCSSHDIEDVITVMDGRQNLSREIEGSATEVRAYIGKECQELLASSRFHDGLPGYVLPDEISQGRIKELLSLSPGTARATRIIRLGSFGANCSPCDRVRIGFRFAFARRL